MNRSTRRMFKLVLGIIIAILAIIYHHNSTLPSPSVLSQIVTPTSTIAPVPTGNLVKVIKVVDGDTVTVEINGQKETVRLIGVDTPEVVDPRKPVQCFGREASAKSKELMIGKFVVLVSDPTQGDRDKYGRLLRYVYLEDKTFVNKILIEQGYAFEYTYNLPYKFRDEFKEAQKQAEVGKRGLWADNACPTSIP